MDMDAPDAPGVAGAWLLELTSNVEIPGRVELMFAPGAALIPVMPPRSNTALVIRGKLTAPRAPIFGPASLAPRVGPGLPSDRRPARVRLLSTAIERVHPEWWGAGSGDSTDDTVALQAAFDAAHRDRRDGVPWLRPLVVELAGPYRLMTPLLVGTAGGSATEVNPGTFEVRGVPDAPSRPNLVCDESRFVGEAMIVVQGVDQVRFDEVRFDGRGAPRACLSLHMHGSGAARDESGHHLRRCVFRGATDQLLLADHDTPVVSVPAGRANALLVEGCSFLPSQQSMSLRAVRLRTSPKLGVEFRSTSFVGVASAMLHITSTAVSMTHCYFHNDGAPTRLAGDVPFESLHTLGPEGGVDVFLDTLGGEPPGSVSVMHCASRSMQFLVSRGNAGQHVGGDSTITGLRHALDPESLRFQVQLLGPYLRPWEPTVIPPDPVIPAVIQPIASKKPLRLGGTLGAAFPSKGESPDVRPEGGLVAPGTLVAPSLKSMVSKLAETSDVPNKIVDPKAAQGIVPTAPPLDGQVLAFTQKGFSASYSGPLPPIIDWNGRAQGAGGLILCGCRFDRPVLDAGPAIVGRSLTRPIFDLGVLWGDPDNRSRLIEVVGSMGISTTESEDRPGGPMR